MNAEKQPEDHVPEIKSSCSFSKRVVLVFICAIVLTSISFILLKISHYYYNDDNLQNDYELKSVHLLFRHGDRTPLSSTYPLDPYINETYEPYGHEQLTKTGYFRMFENGKYFRKRYKSFLGLKYNQTEVYAQATDSYRTKLSLQLFAAGMFFPDQTQIAFEPKFNWRPLKFEFPKLESDPILYPLGKSCPRFVKEFNEVYAPVLIENEQLFSNLSKLTGLSFKNAFDIISLASIVDTQVEFSLPLPAWTEDYYPEIIHKLNNEGWGFFLKNELMRRIYGGNFLQKLISDWEEKIAKKTPEKLHIFSAHDGTMVGSLGAFNVWNTNEAPDYGITAIYELKQHRQSGIYGVEIFVRNKDDNEPVLLTIPGCESFCPIQRLKLLLRDHIPTATDCDEND